ANSFEHGQRFRIAVDGVLQFSTAVANVAGVDEDRRNARVDHARLECANAGDLELIHYLAGGEHGALPVRRVHEFHEDFRRGKGDAIELEVAGFLDLAVGNGYVGDDGFPNVALPDAHDGAAVFGNAFLVDQPVADGEGAHGGSE